MDTVPDLHAMCACQSGFLFADCCKPFLIDKKHPNTAEALMRSRYTAYYCADWKYVFKTWHRDSRPSMRELRSAGTVQWLSLKILHREKGLQGDATGQVEFVATYQDDQGVAQIKECSEFIFENDQWFYVNGTS